MQRESNCSVAGCTGCEHFSPFDTAVPLVLCGRPRPQEALAPGEAPAPVPGCAAQALRDKLFAETIGLKEAGALPLG